MEEDLTDRTVCVTGANTGIGRVTAVELARRGATVLLACRSEERTRPVLAEIAELDRPGAAIFVPLNLADLASVQEAAATIIELGSLHVLVNNAGVAGQRGATAQGFELAFGINHVGHFALTTALLEHLRANTPARIVNVSSDSHYQAKGIDFDAVRRPTRSVTGLREYAVSKLANVCFTQELARRVDPAEVTACALHPGVIASDIWRRVPWPLRPIMTRRMKSTADGAQTSLFCATDPALEGRSGRYWEECREKEPSERATPTLGEQLWERSAAWVG